MNSGAGGQERFEDNLRLNRLEYQLRRIYLYSRPRCLGLVLSNDCNLRCIHCYQPRNADNLLRPAAIGHEFRRELACLYPYLSSFRVLGGEVFAMPEFAELLEDVSSTVRRPLLSASTNATLIDEGWAEKIVRTPFACLTVSIDAATPETFARIRRGASLEGVLANVRRIGRWKERLGSPVPALDSFFVVMRSNFREIPRYLELMRGNGIESVSLQVLEINCENLSRTPDLESRELLQEPAEIAELHTLLIGCLARERSRFRMIRTSGLRVLFENNGLDAAFLDEETQGLYPESDALSSNLELCPNPWTTLFITENGDAHICFLSTPVGNLYEEPLARLWNSPAALAQRGDILSGRYRRAGCSPLNCGWREGSRRSDPPHPKDLLTEIRALLDNVEQWHEATPSEGFATELEAVRRLLTSRGQRLAELESLLQQVYEKNHQFHERGRSYIEELEAKNRELEADFGSLRDQFRQYRAPLLVRAARRAANTLGSLFRSTP